MANPQKTLTYRQNMSKTEVYHVMKAVGVPLIVFGLGIFTISNFANFGSRIICPLSGAMWFVGFIVALFMPSQRGEILSQTMITCTIYYLTLIGFKICLAIVSGASSEMIAASYDQAIPLATGNAIPGYLQNLLLFSSVLIPVGYIGMQVKRIFQFRKTHNLQKTFGQKRGLRDNKSGNARMY